MGALMPVGSGPDTEIINVLNVLFSKKNLAALREHNKTEKLFDGPHRLHRVAYRIGAYPARLYPNDDAKRKWFYFLKHLPQPATDAIKKILNDALRATSTIVAVEFSVEENPIATQPHLFPSNNETLDKYKNTAGTKYKVELIVKEQMSDANAEDPPEDEDDGEAPIDWPTLIKPGKTPRSR
jgi:hypothetical protein